LKTYTDPKLEEYCQKHTSAEPALLVKLTQETYQKISAPQMLSGKLEGRLLKMLTQLIQARKILEIGMFTGYSALSFAEAIPTGGKVVTCEMNLDSAMMAKKYFDKSPHGKKIEVRMGPALLTIEILTKQKQKFDLIFMDADKENYPIYYQKTMPLLRSGGLLVVDNCLWSGEVLNPQSKSAKAIDRLNKMILKDKKVESVMLPLRDGVNVVRKI
jgi:caffeoyl-CoA O-methyltransferase